jgi:ABC-type lipoprotein release transport system permease subunit
MEWDLGLQGLGLLLLMSLGFGVIAQVVIGKTTRWLGAIAAAAYFIGGLFTSEVWFGWATGEDLQPNIDGLSFDEVMLVGLLTGIVSVIATWYVTRRSGRASPAVSSRPEAIQPKSRV